MNNLHYSNIYFSIVSIFKILFAFIIKNFFFIRVESLFTFTHYYHCKVVNCFKKLCTITK